MFALHWPTQGIIDVCRHCAARVNLQCEVSERVILIKSLRVKVVTRWRFDTASVALGFRTPMNFSCWTACAIVIVKDVIFGIVTRAVYPTDFTIVIVIIETPG